MSIKLIKVGNSFNVPQKQYICDTETERDNLNAYFGDLALVIETGLTYILNSEGTWMDYPTGGGGGGIDTTMVAEDFSEESPYSQNDLVINEGMLYRATTNVEAGPFDETKWAETNLAAEIEARGGAAAVHPDWNEGSSQSPNYIQNRTHYMGSITELINSNWTGEIDSDNAPEMIELTELEYDGIDYAGMYKLTNSLSEDLNIEDVDLYWHVAVDTGSGIIEDSYNGTYAEVMYNFASDYYQIFSMPSAQAAYEYLISATNIHKFDDEASSQPFESDNNITSAYIACPPFALFYLVKVLEDGTYTTGHEQIQLTKGQYAICSTLIDSNMAFTVVPKNYNSVVPLDYQYTPPLITQKIEDLTTQVGELTPLDIELRDDEFPDFEANHYYEAGDLIYHNFKFYGAIFSGSYVEFDTNDWFLFSSNNEYHYVMPYIKGMVDHIAYYDTFLEAVNQGRKIRIFIEGEQPREFSLNKVIDSNSILTFRIQFIDGPSWDFIINDNFDNTTVGKYNALFTPYLAQDVFDIKPFNLYPSSTDTYRVTRFLKDRRLLATRAGTSSNNYSQNLVLTSSDVNALNPWIIALEGTEFKKYTFNDDGTKSTEVIFDIANPSGGGSSVDALDVEEMLELFAEKELISSPGLGYYEFTADPNGEYVYDSELGEYRLAREGETGEYSATISLVGYEENGTTYVLVF